MTLNELRYVVAVARERHFRRAAERCFVSQPALSAAIGKLDTALAAVYRVTKEVEEQIIRAGKPELAGTGTDSESFNHDDDTTVPWQHSIRLSLRLTRKLNLTRK